MLASDKQIAYLASLVSSRDLSTLAEGQQAWLAAANYDALTKAQASRVIDRLASLPRTGDTTPADLDLGIPYLTTDGLVCFARESSQGRTYGVAWSDEAQKFVYERGVLGRIARALTLDEAEAFGCRVGVCACCGRTLTNPESVARGIGPICAQRF